MRSEPPILLTHGARRFFDYWDSLPRVGLVPDRSAFNPAKIADLMRAVTILEIRSPAEIEIRLAGTAVCEAMGFEATGRNGLDLVAPDARPGYLKLIAAQVDQPCGRWNVLRVRQAGGAIMRSEAITLPMLHAQSGHHMILSYFGTIETVGYEEGSYQILAYEDTRWIDIGAGVPDWI